MGLLKALGLETQLPTRLADNKSAIKQAEDKLGLDQDRKKALALAETAKTVAENLDALDGKVEAALLEGRSQAFDLLSQRIGTRAVDDKALETDAMELQMLAAETEVALKDNKKNRDALTAARSSFAEALVKRLDSGGDLAADLKTYIDGLVGKDSAVRLSAAIKALDELRNSADDRVKKAAESVSAQLAAEAQDRQKKMGPSLAPRDASRTPNDVLVHLMSLISDAMGSRYSKRLDVIAKEGRALFMGHTLTSAAVADLLKRAKVVFDEYDEKKELKQCDTLSSQLPEDDKDLTPAQMQDNLYGRVFDSKMVGELVKSPPQELLDASAASGDAFANRLADNAENERAAKYVIDHYVIGDKRPWSAAVPGFAELAKAKTGAEALKAVKDFLSTPPTTGQEIIAFSYLMTKLSIGQQVTGTRPDFMTRANDNYGKVIQKQAVRDRAAPEASKVRIELEGAGITLLHQPNAVDDDSLIPSERPGTTNRFGNRGDRELDEVERSDAIKLQHERAMPFASGVSGSTNILLHLYDDMVKKGDLKDVDGKEFLMNSMMFLVYDGGHSMHEVMWTANQLDKQLDLKLKLGDPDKPIEFVSNYDVLVDQFGDELKKSMKEAQDEAWKGTQEYLKANSFFAQV